VLLKYTYNLQQVRSKSKIEKPNNSNVWEGGGGNETKGYKRNRRSSMPEGETLVLVIITLLRNCKFL
jgi:hypothetical protein